MAKMEKKTTSNFHMTSFVCKYLDTIALETSRSGNVKLQVMVSFLADKCFIQSRN